MATGGSTNHVIHLVAMARAVGLTITWDDMADLSRVTPLLARVYPNGEADVNQFHAAGGMGFIVRELIDAGLAHESAMTTWGPGLAAYAKEPFLQDSKLVWRDAPDKSLDEKILRPASNPFSADGGLKLLRGNLGRSVIKTSACDPDALGDHRAGAGVREPGIAGGGIEGGYRRRFHRRGPRAGPTRQRHARAAQADPGDVGFVSQGPSRRHRHRWPHVGSVRQGAVGDPSDARGGGGWADFEVARWRHHQAGCASGCARSAGRCGRAGRPPACEA